MSKSKNTEHFEEAFSQGSIRKELYQMIYPFRILGMLSGSVICLVIAAEKQLAKTAYLWIFFTCFIWPHIAYLLAKFSKNSKRAEVHNLLADSVLAGFIIGLIQFSLLPSAVIFMTILADRINVGIRKLPYKVIPLLLLGILLSVAIMGLEVDLESSFLVIIVTLPLLVIHSVAISYNNYRLIRKVIKQNKRLSDLNRIDTLTRLDSRTFWSFKAQNRLRQNSTLNLKSTEIKQAIILLDVDHFKKINDKYGHISGDAVLSTVSKCLRLQAGEKGFCGRLGGDEFMVYMLDSDRHHLERYLNRVIDSTESLKIENNPEISCSLSIGAVQIDNCKDELSDWLEKADQALYKAKQNGRNQWRIFET